MNYLENLKQELEAINNKTMLFRSDLKSDLLLSKAAKMASETMYSAKYYLLEFQILASKGKPMPWESC